MRAERVTPSAMRLRLRKVFLQEATPVRLAEILGDLDFPPGTPGSELPLRGRSVAVLADPAGEAEADLLASDLMGAVLRPTEVVVPHSASRLPGIQRLRAEGITVRTVRFSAPDTPEELTRNTPGAPVPRVGGLGPDRWAALAERATAPWAHLWNGPLSPTRLADLVCAVECSDADAVGASAGDGHGPGSPLDGAGDLGFFDRPDTGAPQYVFVSELVPELARTRLLRRGWNPDEWNRRGTRLLALGPDNGPAGPDADDEDAVYNSTDASTGAVG
jgi:hypothetical protein